METQTTTLKAALVVAFALIGIAPMPVGAVETDCDKDFDIPDSEPLVPRTLPANDNETGRIEVTGNNVVEVEVKLMEPGTLNFGVFVDASGCVTAISQSMSNCSGVEEVITTQELDPQSEICKLKDPGTYYFHLVNNEDDDLDYKIWRL